MPNILLPIPHQQQRRPADCLAACTAMALDHVGVPVTYDQLLKLLKIKSFGAAGQNLKYLTSLDVDVVYREGSLEELKQHLLDGNPCITLLRTADLFYWSYATDHAVLVVGFDENHVQVNDPAFTDAPIAVPVTEFELAWMVFDYRYGLVRAKGES